MRRNRRVYFVVLLLMVAAALFLLLSRSGHEPQYNKWKLSDWVLRYPIEDAGFFMLTNSRSAEISDAIRQIGSNAVPYLLAWMQYEKPAWKSHLQRAIKFTFGRRTPSRAEIDQKEKRAAGAMHALIVLGTNAQIALPSLEKMLNDSKALVTAERAANVLPHLGDAGLASVLALLTNQQAKLDLRYYVAGEIGAAHTNQPALQQLLKDSDWAMRAFATNMLEEINAPGRKK